MQETGFSGGGGVNSCGSMSTLSEEDSCSYPDEAELELGLGLSLGGGGGSARSVAAGGGGSGDRYARILTANDFPSGVSTKASSSSSSSSSSCSSPVNNNGSCGTKRTAEPSSPPGRSAVSQVVGWPPIRAYRMNSLMNHAKYSPATEESISSVDICKSASLGVNKNVARETRGTAKTCLFVKVNMDGIPIGRKVDLNAHSCYETLAHMLHHMFRLSDATRSDQCVMACTGRPVRLLDESSDFVLTYEDKEGDWMLVGDVPWEMFLSSVRRLRIRRTAEANGIGMYAISLKKHETIENSYRDDIPNEHRKPYPNKDARHRQ